MRHYNLRRGANVADVQVNLVHKDERDDQSHAIAQRLRERVDKIAAHHGAATKVVEVPPGPPVLSTLVAEVYGPNHEERERVAHSIRDIFMSTDGVVDVDCMVEAPQRKLVFEVDREKAALQGVPATQVVRSLRLALSGEDAGLLHIDKEVEPVTIRLELPRAERSSASDLGQVYLASMHQSFVPLSELVRVRETTLKPTLHRKNLKPVVYVTGDVAGTIESPAYAMTAMNERIAGLELPDGELEIFYRDEPWSTERAAIKWGGG